MKRVRLITALLSLLAGSTLPAQVQVGAGATATAPGLTGADLAVQAWNAQTRVAYKGYRLYFFDFGDGRRLQEEKIAVKPEGKGKVSFRLELSAILDSRMKGRGGVLNLSLAQALFSMREGSNFKFRGFRIHNLDLALRNYSFRAQGEDKVAGRACRVLMVVPKDKDRRAWKVWIDTKTGLVLKYWEISPEGQVVSGMEMEAQGLQVGPRTSFRDVGKWWRPSGKSRTFRSLGEAEKAFKADAVVPSYLPWGYMLMEIRLAKSTAGRPFLVLTYTDGIDTFSVIQGRPQGKPDKVAPPVGGDLGSPLVIHRYRLGCLTQLWATVQGRMIMLVGRMSTQEVPLVFQTML